MDKKYTSLENTIRNVVRGNTGAAQNNRSLESKIRSVVLKEEVELDEGSAKFAKIMARTAAARGEPITTDTTELEKKHNELLQTSREAADRAKQARTDYETLAKKYGITPEPIGEEASINEGKGAIDIIDAGLKYAPKILPEIGAGVKTVIKKLDNWSPPGWSARVEKGAGSTELALPSPKTVTAPTKAPDISFQPPVAKTGTDVAIPGQPFMPKPNATVDIPNIVEPTVTPPKIATPKPTIVAKPKNVTEPVTKPGVSPKPGSVPKAGGAGRIAKGIGAAGAAAEIADFLFGGSGGAAIPNNNDSAPAGDRIDLSRHRHYAKARQVYGQEIHYNEYEPAGDYIGEDSAEQTDAERSAIENVARPNSKNKLTKQAELRNKIIEDTQRRKAVILRAKEENKNDKDGANPDIEIKPELKHVHVHEIVGQSILNRVGSGVLTNLGINTGVGGAGGAIENGQQGIVPGIKQGIEDTFPGARQAYRDFRSGNYGRAASGVASAVTRGTLEALPYYNLATTGIALGMKPSPAGSEDELEFERRNNAEMDAKNPNRVMPAGTPEGTVAAPKPNSVGAVGGAAAGEVITQSSVKPKTGFGDAFAAARKAHGGSGGTFDFNGKKYSTDLATDKRPAKSVAGSDYEANRAKQLNANPNSVGAQSAGNRSVEAATKSLNTNTPVVAPQPSPGINSTNTETPRTMGSSWNNSYKNKYSMGPGPSQFPSK